jgi:hypothetical protein
VKYRRFILFTLIVLLTLAACRPNTSISEEVQTYDYAAGSLNYPVLLNGVGIQIDQAGLLAVQDESNEDYVHVLLTLTISNQSEADVVPPTMTLVDDHGNVYQSWQSPLPYEDQISRVPLAVPEGDSGTGNLIFIVPRPAITDNLRLRWDSAIHQSRIDVFLGELGERVG